MADVNQEAIRACNEAQLYDKEPEIQYNSEWAAAGVSEAAVQALADGCLTRALDAQIASAASVDVDTVVKNPDAVKGQVFQLVAYITQFDGATGTCQFRGEWDNVEHEYSFDYSGDNAYFTSGDGDSECPILDGIDQSDTVRLWVRGTGTLTYDTQAGGSTTVPSFKVLKAEVIRKE